MGQLRAHEQILEALRAQIEDGSLGVGDRLPAERELAARFGVSRTSVREAIRVLEVMGIVSVRRGAEHGTLAAAVVAAEQRPEQPKRDRADDDTGRDGIVEPLRLAAKLLLRRAQRLASRVRRRAGLQEQQRRGEEGEGA